MTVRGFDTGNDCCGTCGGSATYDCGGDDNAGGGDDDGGDDGSAGCVDTDNGGTDAMAMVVTDILIPKLVQWVRWYDFISSEMCCACGGGSTGAESAGSNAINSSDKLRSI